MGKPDRSLSRAEVRRLDRRAIDHWGVPGLVLMENAGRNAAAVIERFLHERRPGGARPGGKVGIVCGAGNNGGDGFVIARHLHLRGHEVGVFLLAQRDRVSGDAGVNLAILEKMGFDIRPRTGDGAAALAEELRGFDLVVDAVGGTGITGPLRGDAAAAVAQINAAGRPVVAVDIPTGLDCDTGQAAGPAVRADLTVTMAARKKGFDAPGAGDYTGPVVVVDIGVPPSDPPDP